MLHKYPSQRKGWAMSTKWNNEYFARIELGSAFYYYYENVISLNIVYKSDFFGNDL